MKLQFPENFLWGAATSAHQVEGRNFNNDWWQAEESGLIRERSGNACDHYNLFEKDFAQARNLSHNAHRFSIEWSRIEPEEGKFNLEATNHYRKVLISLREHKLEPVVTLHHFTNPLWFAQIGGWTNHESAKYFSRYADYCAREFGDYIKWWVTINEPTMTVMSYIYGKWPPFKRNAFFDFFKVIQNFASAHKAAYKIIHKANPKNFISIAHNAAAYNSANDSILEKGIVKLAKFFSNDYFLYLIRNHFDYIGLNYYFYRRLSASPKPKFIVPKDAPVSDIGWEINSKGLLQVLRELNRHKKPILITENGLADKSDRLREQFILSHLLMLYAALAEGIDVLGYIHRSLVDNFEWAEGFEPKFGLIEIDRATMERKVRKSAEIFAGIAKNNSIAFSDVRHLIESDPEQYPEIFSRFLPRITRIKPDV